MDKETADDAILVLRADYDALIEALRMARKYVVRCIDVHNEGADSHLEEIDAALAKAATP